MNRIKIIEKAILFRGYSISEIFAKKGFVRKVEGVANKQQVIWDGKGQCFSKEDNKPLHQFDLYPRHKMYLDVDARGIATLHNIYKEDLEKILKSYSDTPFGLHLQKIAQQVKSRKI